MSVIVSRGDFLAGTVARTLDTIDGAIEMLQHIKGTSRYETAVEIQHVIRLLTEGEREAQQLIALSTSGKRGAAA